MRLHLHPERFVRVRVPASLASSLQRALAGIHGPFVTAREGDGFVVTLQEVEWDRLGRRFASARVERGWRVISVEASPADPSLAGRLAAAAAQAGITAVPLPAFHRDHLMVPDRDAARCLEVLTRLLQQTGGP